MDQRIFTKEGLQKLEEELHTLKTEKRFQVAERIKIAKEFGDLSENAEYHEAKEEQSFVEGRIIELERLIKTAVVADASTSKGIVVVGSKVKVLKVDQELNFTIVGSTEADPANAKISLESPMGSALLGHKVGDEIEIQMPAGKTTYKIIEII